VAPPLLRMFDNLLDSTQGSVSVGKVAGVQDLYPRVMVSVERCRCTRTPGIGPALVASVGSANQIPRSSSSTGTAGVPGFRMKVSSLKIPVTSTTPLPRALVVRSPWYHAGVKGAFGVLMTNSVKSVFEQLTCEKSAEIRSRQNAL
jgi:hypothetical protein